MNTPKGTLASPSVPAGVFNSESTFSGTSHHHPSDAASAPSTGSFNASAFSSRPVIGRTASTFAVPRQMGSSLVPPHLQFAKSSTPALLATSPPKSAANRSKTPSPWELRFPCPSECFAHPAPGDIPSVQIPNVFATLEDYKRIFSRALFEEMNAPLLELSKRFADTYAEITDVSSALPPSPVATQTDLGQQCPRHPGVAIMQTVHKDGPNKGKRFLSCPVKANTGCDFFAWATDADLAIARHKVCTVASSTNHVFACMCSCVFVSQRHVLD